MIKAIFFDLDGTLLPMDENKFTMYYFKLLCDKMSNYGFEANALQSAIWGGVKAMYKNDGTKTNEEAFFDYFKTIFGEESIKLKPVFEEFYRNEFKQTINCVGKNPYSREIVDFARNNFSYVILSTNPIFPKVATIERMEFVNLKEDDFDFITTYENSSYTKPNPKYFLELLKKFSLKPEEVVLFGNNTLEDYACATSIGIKTIMVGENIIHSENESKDIEYIYLNELKDRLLSLKDSE